MLKELCLLNSTSGDEKAVRDFIIDNIKNYCEYSVDSLGNIIAYKKGKQKPINKVMLCAHMDEVGFIITDITDDGYLKFSPVGGIDPNVVCGRSVSVNSFPGVIGTKPIHLLSDEEKNSPLKFKDLVIDIGADDKDEALIYVKPGDFAYFISDYCDFGENRIVSKALDDRIGCRLLCSIIKSDFDFDTYFCFNVQEEVGLRGALCSSYAVEPDISIVVEATTACDINGVVGSDKVCELGKGPVVSYMDNRTIYDKYLYHLAMDTANLNSIPVQTKTVIAGGNDAGAIQTSHGGSRVIAISVPCRYIHTGASVADLDDIKNTRKLIKTLVNRVYG